ncbi:MAG: TetR/AcrR family transcriptional regulator [Acidimicrobiales bacterium]
MDSSDTGELGRRELRKQLTRRDIMAAAHDLFEEVGYHDARTAEIARRAGVSEPTVFRYFPTKADVAMAPFHEWVESLTEQFIDLLGDATPYEATIALMDSPDPLVFLEERTRLALDRTLDQPELISQVFWALDTAVRRLIPELATYRGVAADDVSALLDAQLVVSVIEVSIRQWITTDGASAPLALVRNCAQRLEPILDT